MIKDLFRANKAKAEVKERSVPAVKPETRAVFSRIHKSQQFSAQAAHKAFGGLRAAKK